MRKGLSIVCFNGPGLFCLRFFLEEGGPLPTTFTLVPDRSLFSEWESIGGSTPVKEFDSVFLMPIGLRCVMRRTVPTVDYFIYYKTQGTESTSGGCFFCGCRIHR